jgi:uncharacterized membrane protein YhaH (DUF805 family)
MQQLIGFLRFLASFVGLFLAGGTGGFLTALTVPNFTGSGVIGIFVGLAMWYGICRGFLHYKLPGITVLRIFFPFQSWTGVDIVDSAVGNKVANEIPAQVKTGEICPHCSTPIEQDHRFCPNCSELLSNEGFNLGRAITYIWRGRLNRLGILIANTFFYGVTNFLINPMLLTESWTILLAAGVLIAVFAVLQFGTMCSRLHDIGKPGYWAIPWFVWSSAYGLFFTTWSLVVLLMIAIPCIFWPGEDRTNQWGTPGIGIVKYSKRILGMNYS